MNDWIVADWPAPEGIIAGTTTRNGGVSEGVYATLNLGAHVGDAPIAVAENRRRFVELSMLRSEPGWLNQVHGTNVHLAGEPPTEEADAAVSCSEPVAVLTADCLPILLCARTGDEYAAIHGGWRSLAAGIIDVTLSKMRTPPPELLAWLGPGISQAAFEVGEVVRRAFVEQHTGAGACFQANGRGRWQADLDGLARLDLEAAGVRSIYGGGWCTHADASRFFSYRRDGQCGRMSTFIGRAR